MLISRTSSGRGEFEKFFITMDGALLTTATLEIIVLIDILLEGDYVCSMLLDESDLLCLYH